MKILKVIVDEMPKSCMDCICKVNFIGADIFRRCIPMNKKLEFPVPSTRPDWCPLVKEPVKWWETAQTLGNSEVE